MWKMEANVPFTDPPAVKAMAQAQSHTQVHKLASQSASQALCKRLRWPLSYTGLEGPLL